MSLPGCPICRVALKSDRTCPVCGAEVFLSVEERKRLERSYNVVIKKKIKNAKQKIKVVEAKVKATKQKKKKYPTREEHYHDRVMIDAIRAMLGKEPLYFKKIELDSSRHYFGHLEEGFNETIKRHKNG